MASLINKARKPKFELHLTIYDLNNVPLVAGTSTTKWHLPNSISGEHRGRTSKCSIDKINHRVVYNYSKIVPIRISIDRSNNLSECPIEFEVLQEFPMGAAGRDERIPLGVVRLNLSEYVEESENFPRRSMGASRVGASLEHAREKVGTGLSHRRHSSSRSGSSAGASVMASPPGAASGHQSHPEENDIVDEEAEEGIVRRYLMQDSKINSTLKIGILMVQIDGERNFVAPPLKTAPMFGGIAGIMTGSEQIQVEPPSEDGSDAGGPNNNNNANSLNKSRDASELQDMYRRSLAASWACQRGELPADECIEDIFSGGDGWSDSLRPPKKPTTTKRRRSQAGSVGSSNSNSPSSPSGDDTAAANGGSSGTLRPGDIRRMRQHLRTHSGASDRSAATARPGSSESGGGGLTSSFRQPAFRFHSHHRQPGSGAAGARPHHHKEEDDNVGSHRGDGLRSRSQSAASLATNPGSDRGREGFRPPREVDEYEEREDLLAWKLPESVA
ncbi:N-terminal C2 in EEIG1 and EHBP1 proteins-domain-containing protein [Hypoxylon sp. FL1284]|nr:N-terminal C2 in EEIG1 and EHBP1 proteins-domain-containing protein [Hypoxylon sp. FL1284]